MRRREAVQPEHAMAAARKMISSGAAHCAQAKEDGVIDHIIFILAKRCVHLLAFKNPKINTLLDYSDPCWYRIATPINSGAK